MTWFYKYTCDECYFRVKGKRCKGPCDKFVPKDETKCLDCLEQKMCKEYPSTDCQTSKVDSKVTSFQRQSCCVVNGLKTDVLIRSNKDKPISFILKVGKTGLLVQYTNNSFDVQPVKFSNRQLARHHKTSGNYRPKTTGEIKLIKRDNDLLYLKIIPSAKDVPLDIVESKETVLDISTIIKDVEKKVKAKKGDKRIEKIILETVKAFTEKNGINPEKNLFIVKEVGKQFLGVPQ